MGEEHEMAAVLKEIPAETPTLREHYERLALRAIDGELNDWGRWIERHADFEGHPSANILATYIGGAGGSTPGHRILCLDMPDAIYATHGRVLLLTEALRDAICAWYIVRLNADGTLIALAEKCLRLGIAERTLRDRVRLAKLKILGLPA